MCGVCYIIGHFPDPQFDPVIQIANTVTLQGSTVPIIRHVFTLNTCLPIVGAQVICSATEEELLMKWRSFVLACDPDLITGYNIANFDFPYLLNRAKVIVENANKTIRLSQLLFGFTIIDFREKAPNIETLSRPG